jgi:succinyl-CoA synthetase alpha subunit
LVVGKSEKNAPFIFSKAVSALKPHASAVFVPPMLAANAIIEAIEEEIPLIVSVAEGIPLHDQMKVTRTAVCE